MDNDRESSVLLSRHTFLIVSLGVHLQFKNRDVYCIASSQLDITVYYTVALNALILKQYLLVFRERTLDKMAYRTPKSLIPASVLCTFISHKLTKIKGLSIINMFPGKILIISWKH